MQNAYRYPRVYEYCKKVSEAFGVDLLHVIPVSNYFDEVVPNDAKNAMSLFNLWRVFISTKEYIERRWVKEETIMISQEWSCKKNNVWETSCQLLKKISDNELFLGFCLYIYLCWRFIDINVWKFWNIQICSFFKINLWFFVCVFYVCTTVIVTVILQLHVNMLKDLMVNLMFLQIKKMIALCIIKLEREIFSHLLDRLYHTFFTHNFLSVWVYIEYSLWL